MLATAENHTNAKALLADTIRKQHIAPGQLYIHSDRGSPMIAKPVAFMLAELGVTKSHSRPHCSNDNPYSESQFRTLKYRPEFPDRFGSFELPPVGRSRWLRGRVGLGLMIGLLPGDGGDVAEGGVPAA
jgi:transposase InsO family protein